MLLSYCYHFLSLRQDAYISISRFGAALFQRGFCCGRGMTVWFYNLLRLTSSLTRENSLLVLSSVLWILGPGICTRSVLGSEFWVPRFDSQILVLSSEF